MSPDVAVTCNLIFLVTATRIQQFVCFKCRPFLLWFILVLYAPDEEWKHVRADWVSHCLMQYCSFFLQMVCLIIIIIIMIIQIINIIIIVIIIICKKKTQCGI